MKDDCKESAWAFRELMKLAQADIDSGKRPGATVLFKTASHKVRLNGIARRVIPLLFKRAGK